MRAKNSTQVASIARAQIAGAVQREPIGCYSRRNFAAPEDAVMARANKFSDPLDQKIHDAHRHYIEVMEDIRMGSISKETKEKYLQIISALSEKLALPSKPLSEIIGER